jgi:hypothetical protein
MLHRDEIWLDHWQMVNFFALEHANHASMVNTRRKDRKEVIE